MKVCFVGLGSIGKRHLKNLFDICKERTINLTIHAYRTSKINLDENISKLIDKEIFDINDVHNDYDIVFITNPTYKHFESVSFFGSKTKHMFIEKPIFNNSVNEELLKDFNINDGVYYVAAPLRFKKVYKKLKEVISNEIIYSSRVICSSYLPDWRKNNDYRKNYSAIKTQGGGVSKDCIHEIDYVIDIFGFPKNTINIKRKYSHLEIDSEDIAVFILDYNDKIVEIHLDYFGRKSKREIELITKERIITANFIDNEIKFSDKKKISFREDRNYMYVEEMKYFLDIIYNNNKNINDIFKANKVLKIVEGE